MHADVWMNVSFKHRHVQTLAAEVWMPMFETYIHSNISMACIQTSAADLWMGVANEYVLLYAPLSRLFYLHISKFSGPKTCTRAMAPKNINSIVEILFFFYIDKLLFNCISRCSRTSKRCRNTFRYWLLCRLYNHIKASWGLRESRSALINVTTLPIP